MDSMVGRSRTAGPPPSPDLAHAIGAAATFIGGVPKSGTSLLLTLLDSHPQLVVYPEETRFFLRFIPATAGLPPGRRLEEAEQRILHVFRWNQSDPDPSQAGFLDRDYGTVGYERVRQAYQRNVGVEGHDYPSILAAAILAYGEVAGHLGSDTLRWVEKSPYNERFADRIFGWWPGGRFLHIVRDPRDNYASYRRKKPDWSPASFAYAWRASIRQGWRNAAQYGPRLYRIVRYEDLVEQPEESMSQIADFLGIRPDPILHRPTRNGKPWKGNSMFGERFSGISSHPVGRFRSSLESPLRRELESLLYTELSRLGYEVEVPPTLAARGRRALAVAKWWIHDVRETAAGHSTSFDGS